MPTVLSVWVQFGSHLARLSRFQWFFETAASRSGAMNANGTQCFVQLGSHLARLSRCQWFYETAASRSGAMGADDIQCLVQLGSHLGPCSPRRFQWFFETAASRSGAVGADGILSAWYSLAHTLLAFHAFNGSSKRLPHA